MNLGHVGSMWSCTETINNVPFVYGLIMSPLSATILWVLRKRLPCCRSIASPLSLSSITSTSASSSVRSCTNTGAKRDQHGSIINLITELQKCCIWLQTFIRRLNITLCKLNQAYLGWLNKVAHTVDTYTARCLRNAFLRQWRNVWRAECGSCLILAKVQRLQSHSGIVLRSKVKKLYKRI